MLALFLLAGCAAHMAPPAGFPEPAVAFAATGRGDLAPGYQIGPYRVERPTGGWSGGPNATGTGLVQEVVGFGFELVGPSGTALAARCEAGGARPPGSGGMGVLEDALTCTAEGLVLRLGRSVEVRGELTLAGRTLAVEPVRQPGGLAGPVVAGVAIREGDLLLAAVDLLGSGTLLVGATVAEADRERFALVAAALLGWPPPR